MSAIRSGLIVSLACAACIAAAPIVFAAGVPAVSTQEPAALRNLRIVPPKSARVGTAQEEINKRIVLQWHYEFFDLGHFADASNKYMAEDFQQNDSREPSGRANYVHNFETNGYRPMAAERRPPLVAVFAQGDLVMTVIPDGWPRSDGSRADQGAIHCNMYRVRNNRIVAMWVSGGGGAPAAGPAAAPAAGPAAAPPAALAAAADASASCDRECLQGLVSNYVNALLRHEPSAVKATPNYKATLNGEPLRGTDSLWKTLEGIQSGPQYVSDVPNQEIGYLGVVTDAGQPAFLALRLKVANGLITEAESILTHDGEGGPAFEPAGLIYRESPYIRDVPKAHRSSRAELLKVANSYWDISTTTHRGETIPYTVDCWHFENGMNTDAERMLTARESPTAIESQPQDFDGRIWTCAREAILSTTAWTAARDRHFIVDEDRGLVFNIAYVDTKGRGNLGGPQGAGSPSGAGGPPGAGPVAARDPIDGPSVGPIGMSAAGMKAAMAGTPYTTAHFEVMRIVGGKIAREQDVMRVLPDGAQRPF